MRKIRVSFGLPSELMDVLEKLAAASHKSPSLLARDIMSDTLIGMINMFQLEDGQLALSGDQAMNRMLRAALGKMLEAMNEVSNDPMAK